MKVCIDQDLCVGCGICIKRCNLDAITLVDKKAVVDRDHCIGCGLCEVLCLYDAIYFDRNLTANIDPQRCTNCKACILACPTHAITEHL